MPDPSPLPAGTLLAFDFGEKRIGVAVGETALAQAHPLTVIHAQANDERFGAIGALIAEWHPVLLVVGEYDLGAWVDAQVDPRTNIDIENAILTRARQLRIAGGS